MNQSPNNTTPTSHVFLDANIVLEIVLGRANEAAARRILAEHAGNLYISALAAHLVVHFGVKRTSLDVLNKFLTDYTILPLNDFDFDWAFTNCQNNDFEDALQLAVATSNGCGTFITFDKLLHKTYAGLAGLEIRLA